MLTIMSTYQIPTLKALEDFTRTLIDSLQPKESATIIALTGDLGAGKTTFVQNVATLLGVSEVVVSPTFVIMKQYATTHSQFNSLVHIDAYRIENETEIAPLGLSELLGDANTIICIEWPEHCSSIIPEDAIRLSFEGLEEKRSVTRVYNGN